MCPLLFVSKILKARFRVLRDVRIPAVLVECGYLSNADNRKAIVEGDYLERAAKAIVEGIVEFTGGEEE